MRRSHLDDQVDPALCLTLVTNAVSLSRKTFVMGTRRRDVSDTFTNPLPYRGCTTTRPRRGVARTRPVWAVRLAAAGHRRRGDCVEAPKRVPAIVLDLGELA